MSLDYAEALQLINDQNEGKPVNLVAWARALVLVATSNANKGLAAPEVNLSFPLQPFTGDSHQHRVSDPVLVGDHNREVSTDRIREMITSVGSPLDLPAATVEEVNKTLDGISDDQRVHSLSAVTASLNSRVHHGVFIGDLYVNGKVVPGKELLTAGERLLFNSHLVSTAVMSFCGFLTSLDTPVTLSARHNAAVAVELFREWCEKTGVHDDSDTTQMQDWVKEVHQLIQPQDGNSNG